MKEILDVFDSNHRWLGTADRETVHREGLWHQTFHCWIVRPSGVVFQKRADTKKVFPSLWDVSSAGHLISGESILDGVRELKEELGLNIAPERLKFWKIRLSDPPLPNGLRDREFHHIFFVYDETPLYEMNFQREEISELMELPIEQGLALFSGQTACDSLHIQDFVPRDDYLETFLAIQEFLKENGPT